MLSETLVHTAYFDLEVHRPEDFVWYPHVWLEPEEPLLNRLMKPVADAIGYPVSLDGRVFFLRQSHVSVAELLDLAERNAREFVERIVGDVTMASRENELLQQELRRRIESERQLQQLRATTRLRESRVEPQIPIVDTPIEPMAPCALMSA